MAERKYMVGKYKDYYDSLRGEMTAKGKATTFVSEVQNMVQEFYSISNVMVYWSGQAKNAMTNDAMTRIMDELRITQENLQTNLEPCCEKIDKISNNLTTMQEKEDEYLQLQNDLERVEGELSRLGGTWTYTEGGTRTESEVSSHNAQVEAKEQEKAQLEEKIEAIVAELDALKIELDADIRAIEQFESELQEFTNYVNLTGTVFGVGSSDAFSHYTLEERLNYIQQIMDNYQEIYESLNSVYKERYGKGFSFSIDDFKNLDIIFDSFDIYWMAGLDKNGMRKGTSGNNILFDVDKLTKLISYCSTSGIFDRIEKYLNGASWKESGLEDFYWENSPNALKINVFGEDELKRRLKANYGVDAKDVRSFLKSKYEIFKTSKEHLMVEYGEYQKLSSAMSVIKEKISNLKNAKKLIPYEMQMENPDFQNYLNKDYSGYSYLPADKLELMSQKEIALYDYLLHNKSKQEADNYLAAMKNAFDMRIGAKNAAKYIEWVKEDGFSVDDLGKTGWEGFKDGVRGFGKGIERLFTAWAVEEGDKDAYDYEMMYKSQWLSQLMQDPTFIDQNTVNNTLGWADLNAWYSTSSSIGNMIIPSIIGMIPGGQGLSSALFAVSIAGNSAYEARQQGYSVGQAYLYGAITGASEALTEKMLGGIQGLSTKALGKGIIGNMFNEGLEEFTQEFLDPYVRSKVFGEELDLSAAGMNAMFNRALEAGKYGALTAGVMQAGTSTVSKFVVDPITRRAGVTVTGADGVQRQARTYQEFLQDRTINKTVTKASEVINNSLTKMDNGQTLSLGEKIQLNNALKDVSVQDLSRMKSELSPEKQTQLRQAVEGVAILSSKTNSKLDLADRFAQVSDGKTSLTEVQFEEDDFKEEVTRDGRTLAEYIADTRAGAQTTVTASSSENNTRINGLTTEERAHIDSISHKGLKAIDSQAKHNAKVEKRAARREIIKDYLGLNNGKTDSTRTSTTRTEQGNRDQAGQQDRSGQTEITETRTQTEQGRTEQTQRVESRTQTEQGRTEQTQRVESRTQTEQGRTEQTQRSEAEERIQPAQGAVRSVITEDARVSNSGRTTAEVAKPAQSSQVLDQEVSTNERSKPQVKQNDNSGSNGPVAASSGIVQDSYILGQVLDGQNDADIDSREEISRPHSSETIASQAQEVAKSGASMAAAAAATAGVIGRDVTLSSETATTSSNTSVGQKSNTTTTVGNSENKIGVQENTGFRTEQKKAQDSVIEQNESNVQQTSSETLTQNGDLERKNVLDLIKEQRQQNSNSSSEIVAIDINEISEENDIKEPEKFTPEDWILVRSSPFLPVNGVIQTAYDAGAKGIDPVAKINSERVKSSTFNRHTLHFAINGLVKGGFVGAANWNASPFFVLEPFKYHVNESLVGGFIGDVYFDGNVKLSNEAVILVNRSYYEANRSSLPSEYNYVVFDGDPTIAIEKVMKSMGYLPINQQKRIDNYVGNGDRLQSKMFTDFNNFLESGSYYSGMHDSTIHNTYETSIGTTQALIEYLRGKNIDINSEIKLSESEAFSIVQALANQERMETKMNKSDYDSTAKSLLESTSNESGNAYIFIKYGLKYDVNTGEFSVVSYKEYQQRSKLLYEINQYNNYVNEYNELRNAIDNNLISNPEVLDTSIQKVDFLREKIKFVENNRATIENEISQAKEVIDKHVKAELNAIEESNASRASHIEELNRIKNIRDNKIELSEFLNNNGIDPNVSTELTAREVLDLAHKSGKKTAVFIEKSGLVFNQETGTFTYVGLSDIAGLRQLLSSSDYVSSTNQNYELLIDKIINNRNLIDLTLEQCREGVEFDNIDELISALDEETAKYVIDECNEMLNYEKTRSKGKKTLNSILEQLSKKYNIVSQLEDTIKGLTPAELSQTLLNERYVDVKEYAEQFLESNSSEKAKMLAAVIPAAIQNGDVELINKIKDKISQKEYSQIIENLTSIDENIVNVFETINEENKTQFIKSSKEVQIEENSVKNSTTNPIIEYLKSHSSVSDVILNEDGNYTLIDEIGNKLATISAETFSKISNIDSKYGNIVSSIIFSSTIDINETIEAIVPYLNNNNMKIIDNDVLILNEFNDNIKISDIKNNIDTIEKLTNNEYLELRKKYSDEILSVTITNDGKYLFKFINETTIEIGANELGTQQTVDIINQHEKHRKSFSDLAKKFNVSEQTDTTQNNVIILDGKLEIDEQHEIKEPEKLTMNDLVLVRSTDVLPKNGTIRSQQLDGINAFGENSIGLVKINGVRIAPNIENRNTLHFALNGFVAEVDGNNWNSKPFIIIDPLNSHMNSSFAGGFSGDISFSDKVVLSDKAIILVNKDYYLNNKESLPRDYNYIVFEGDPSTAVKFVLNEMGYHATVPRQQHGGSFDSKFAELLKEYNGGEFSNVSSSPLDDVIYNGTMDRYEAVLEYLRKETVPLVNGDVVLSEQELKVLLLNNIYFTSWEAHSGVPNVDLTKTLKSDSIKLSDVENFLKYGVKFNSETKEFSIVNYKEFESRRMGNVSEAEINDAFEYINEMANRESVQAESVQETVSSQQSSDGIDTQFENEIKGLTPAELSQAILDEYYSEMKEIAEQFLESNSSEKAKMLAAVIPAAIQNGDVELINKIKDKISQKEYSQIIENLTSIDENIVNVFETINEENKTQFIKSSKEVQIEENSVNNSTTNPIIEYLKSNTRVSDVTLDEDGNYTLIDDFGTELATISAETLSKISNIDSKYVRIVSSIIFSSTMDINETIEAIVPYLNNNMKVHNGVLILNEFDDNIKISDIKNNIDTIEKLTNNEYLELRKKYSDEILSVTITNDGKYSFRFNDGLVINLSENDVVNQEINEKIKEERYNYRYQKVNSEIKVESKDGIQYKIIPETELMQVQEPITKLTPKDIMMVHATDYFPKSKVIYANTDVKVDGRNTIHFAGNGLVKGGFAGAGNWSSSKFIILEPAASHIDSSFKGGFFGDFYFDKPVKLQSPTLIIRQSTFEQLTSQELQELSGYDVYVISGNNIYQDVSNVIKSKGYRAVETTAIPATGVDYHVGSSDDIKKLTLEQKQCEKAFTEMIADLNKKGITNARSRFLHARSVEMKMENAMSEVAGKLSELRHTDIIGIGRKTIPISSDEFFHLVKNRLHDDIDSVLERMNEYGLEYNPETEEFTIADVDRWKRINNDASIYEDKKRARKALEAVIKNDSGKSEILTPLLESSSDATSSEITKNSSDATSSEITKNNNTSININTEEKPILLYQPEFTMEQNKQWENYDKAKLDQTFESTEVDGVTYYTASGEQFKFLAHVIDSTGGVKPNGSTAQVQEQIRYLQENLVSHPELFATSGLDNSTISCSTISDKGMQLFSLALLYPKGKVILGFNENDINKVYEYYSHDAGTVRDAHFNSYNETVYRLGKEYTRMDAGSYDEVIISREGRKPSYIISPYPPSNTEANANNIKWAKAYGIPIVYINRSAYASQYREQISSITAKLDNGEVLTQTEYYKVISLCAALDSISSSERILLETNNRMYDALAANLSHENIENIFEINDGDFVYEKYNQVSLKGTTSSVVFDAIINHFGLDSKFPNLTRDEIANILKEYAKMTQDANSPSRHFDFELGLLEKNAGTINTISEILRRIENGGVITKNDVQVLQESEYLKYMTGGDMSSLFEKTYEQFHKNPTKNNIENLYKINPAEAEIRIYDEYTRCSFAGESSNTVFDAIILKNDLEAKYPNLTREEIINNLIESASISRDSYSFSFRFELSQLDKYAKSVESRKTTRSSTTQLNSEAVEIERGVTLDQEKNIKRITVSEIDTERQATGLAARGVDPNVMNISYQGYDTVYKTSTNNVDVINQVITESPSGKVLIELDSTTGLTQELLDKLPNNTEIRVIGEYGVENFKGLASNESGLASLKNVTYTAAELKEILSVIEKFENGIDPSWDTRTKAQYAYDFLVNEIQYNPEPAGGNVGRAKNYDGLASLIERESTSQGFAHTYKELLTRMGIECHEISGSLVGGHSQHAFNVVNIDGEMVIVDSTRPSLTGFDGTGFDVENINQYVFKSNKELMNPIEYSQAKRLAQDIIDKKIILNAAGEVEVSIVPTLIKNNNVELVKELIKNGNSNPEVIEAIRKVDENAATKFEEILVDSLVETMRSDESNMNIDSWLSLDNEYYLSLKEYLFDKIINHSSAVDYADVIAPVIPAIIKNGDIDLINKIRENTSLNEKVSEKLREISPNNANIFEKYGRNGFEIASIESKIKEQSIADLSQQIQENESNIDTYHDYVDQAVLLAETKSSERIKMISAIASSLIKNGDIDVLTKLKSSLTIDERFEIRQNIEQLNNEASKVFANINMEGDIQLYCLNTFANDMSQEAIKAHVDNLSQLDSEASRRYFEAIRENAILREGKYKESGRLSSNERVLVESAESVVSSLDLSYFSDPNYQLLHDEFGVKYKTKDGSYVLRLEYYEGITVSSSIIDEHVQMLSSYNTEMKESYFDCLKTILKKYVYSKDQSLINSLLSNYGQKMQSLDSKAFERYESFVIKNINENSFSDCNEILKNLDTTFFEDENYETLKNIFGVDYKFLDGKYHVSPKGLNSEFVDISVIDQHLSIYNSLNDDIKKAYIDKYYDNTIISGQFRSMTGYFEWLNYLTPESTQPIQILESILLDPEYNFEFSYITSILNGMKDKINSFDLSDSRINLIQDTVSNLSLENDIKKSVAYFLGTKIEELNQQLIDETVDLTKSITNTNSLEMKKYTTSILREAFKSSNPQLVVERIKNIFEKNNLPIVGKLYKCFEVLHPNFEGYSFDNNQMSPFLQESGNMRRKVTVFSDLIKASFGSNNRSINSYLNNIEFGQKIFEQIKNGTFKIESLSESEINELETFRNHLITMYENTLVGKYDVSLIEKTGDYAADIMNLANLLSPDGTLEFNLGDRLVDMFCGFADIKTIAQAKEYISSKIENAERRNIEASKSDMALEEGDLIKGIGDVTYLGDILQNGSIARDYLGAYAGTDYTPLDTDLSLISSKLSKISDKVHTTAASSYGPIYFVLKNDSRFETTRTKDGKTNVKHDNSKIELFHTGVISNDHYGIRTGFASSEINYILMNKFDPRVGLEIAKNGFYIPVVDMDGKVTFTYDNYVALRQKISGLDYYGNSEYSISNTLLSSKVHETETRVLQSLSQTRTNVEEVSTGIKNALQEAGISKVFDGYSADLSTDYAEIYSTGSTSRGTNVPGDSDFDYLVKVDREIYFNKTKLDQLKSKLKESLGLEDGPGGKVAGKIKNANGEILDVEISICPRTDKVEFSTDVALAAKLDAIKAQYPGQYEEVLANIVTAKEVLKGAHAYKSAKSGTGEGGLGGIGIENWVLQHGGSFHDAAVDFLRVADECSSFEEFVEKYQVFDLGENHYSDKTGAYPHENFVYETDSNGVLLKMTSDGFERTKTALREYLASEQLIDNNSSSHSQNRSNANMIDQVANAKPSSVTDELSESELENVRAAQPVAFEENDITEVHSASTVVDDNGHINTELVTEENVKEVIESVALKKEVTSMEDIRELNNLLEKVKKLPNIGLDEILDDAIELNSKINEALENYSYTDSNLSTMTNDELAYILGKSLSDKNLTSITSALKENQALREKVIETIKSNPDIVIYDKNIINKSFRSQEIIDNYFVLKDKVNIIPYTICNDITVSVPYEVFEDYAKSNGNVIKAFRLEHIKDNMARLIEANPNTRFTINMGPVKSFNFVEMETEAFVSAGIDVDFEFQFNENSKLTLSTGDFENNVKELEGIIKKIGEKNVAPGEYTLKNIIFNRNNVIIRLDQLNLNENIKKTILETIKNNPGTIYTIGLEQLKGKLEDSIDFNPSNIMVEYYYGDKIPFNDLMAFTVQMDSIESNATNINYGETLATISSFMEKYNNLHRLFSNDFYEKIVQNVDINTILKNYNVFKQDTYARQLISQKISQMSEVDSKNLVQNADEETLYKIFECINEMMLSKDTSTEWIKNDVIEKQIASQIDIDDNFKSKVKNIILNNKYLFMDSSISSKIINSLSVDELINNLDTIELKITTEAKEKILNYDGKVSIDILKKTAFSKIFEDINGKNVEYLKLDSSIKLSEKGINRISQIINSGGNFQIDMNNTDRFGLLTRINNDNVLVIKEDIFSGSRETIKVSDIKNDLERISILSSKITSSLDYLNLVEETIKVKDKYDFLTNQNISSVIDVLNDSKYKNYVNLMTNEELKKCLALNAQKETIISLALNEDRTDIISLVLSEDALSMEERKVINFLRNGCSIENTNVAGVDGSKVRYTTRLNPKVLTEEAIKRINEYTRSNPNITLALDFENTSNLSTSIISQLDESILIKIEGAYSTSFINKKSYNCTAESSYIGSEFLSNVYSRNEAYAIFSKMEEIEARINPSWSEKEKAIFIYDYIKNNISYDFLKCDLENVLTKKNGYVINSYTSDASRSLRGLVSGDAVCAGYAIIYQELLSRQGIQAFYEYGKAVESGHAWNLVVLDGKTYVCDVTWDGIDKNTPIGTTNFEFNTKFEEFRKKHSPDSRSMVSPELYKNIATMSLSEIEQIRNSLQETKPTNAGISDQYRQKLNELRRQLNYEVLTTTKYDELANKYSQEIEDLHKNNSSQNNDADVVNFKPKNISGEVVSDINKSLAQQQEFEYCVEAICNKIKCSPKIAAKMIELASLTKTYLLIPADGNVKSIIKQYTYSEIKNIIATRNKIENVSESDIKTIEYGISKWMEKYGSTREQAISQIEYLIAEKDYSGMTSYGDARNKFKEIGFERINMALQKIKMQEYISSKTNNKHVTSFREVIKSINKNVSKRTERAFENAGSSETSNYGVNQGLFYEMMKFYDKKTGASLSYGQAKKLRDIEIKYHDVLTKFQKIGTAEYFEFKEKVQGKYNLSERDASIIIESIDAAGACSYASVCNEIFNSFLGKETEFENKFGFPMYKTINGKRVFNSRDLLFELYLFTNCDENGGKFIEKTADGYKIIPSAVNEKVDLLGRKTVNPENQKYMSNSGGKNIWIINKYLNTKGLTFESNVIKAYDGTISELEMANIISSVMDGLNNGMSYSMGIYSTGSPIELRAPNSANYNSVSTSNWNEGDGHSIFITGLSEEGFIISSWGQKYIIPYKDLINGGKWVLTEDHIEQGVIGRKRRMSRYESSNKAAVSYEETSTNKVINEGHNSETGIESQFPVSEHVTPTVVTQTSASLPDVTINRVTSNIVQDIFDIDEDTAIKHLKERKTPKKTIEEFKESLAKAKGIVSKSNFVHYDQKLSVNELISLFSDKFGDAGEEVNLLFRDGKTISEIRSILNEKGHDLSSFDTFVNETISGKFLSLLNGRQISAIRKFTGADVHKINDALRNLREGTEYMIIADDIIESLAKAPPLGYDMLVYRGTDVNALLADKNIKKLLNFNGNVLSNSEELYISVKKLIGLKIRDLGFLSTSPGYETSFAVRDNKNIVFEIIVPDGTKGAYINQISDFYNKENEYLLSYGTTLRIINVSYSNKKKVHIQCIVESQLSPSE